MVKKLIFDQNEKGEIVSPSYVDIVSKINGKVKNSNGKNKIFL